MKYTIVIFLFLVFFNLTGNAQPNTSVSGKVFDSSTNMPLQYATVSLIDKTTDKTVTGSIADETGAFEIRNVPFGTYRITIGFIGYQNDTIDNLVISAGSPSFAAGTVFLSPSMLNIQEVTVTGDKPVIENKIDKIVYNVANDVTSQGGLAVDVLKKVPNVTVDLEGNVELQGNSNIRFLIDGKPSSIFGSSVSDALTSIPASQIKSIEAITSPGAKYDAQGTGGIINIILHDNKLKGVNGNINLSAGTRLENGSANLNLRRNNVGFNAFFGGRAFLKSESPSSQNRVSVDSTSGQITTLLQEGNSETDRNGFRSGFGFDWDISKEDNLTGSFGFNQFRFSNSGLTEQEERIADFSDNILTDILTLRNSENFSRNRSYDVSLNYKKTFEKEDQELNILFNNSHGKPYSEYTQTQTYAGEPVPYSGSSSINPGTDNQANFSIDYAHPVSESFLLEAGAKSTFQNLTSISDVSVFTPLTNDYVIDSLQSYDLKYDMTIYAGYLSATMKFGSLSLKTGVRYESTDVKINSDTDIPTYGTIVPNVVISYNFNKKQSAKLSYSKRIERPGYRELNPFTDISDPYFITTGNPLLDPEIGNNFELGFNTGFGKGGNLNFSLFENITSDEIDPLTTFYPEYLIGDSLYTNVSVSTRENVGTEYNSGFTFSGSLPITSRFKIRANIVLTHQKVVSDIEEVNGSTGVRGRFNMNLNYELPKDLVLEAFGFYNSASKGIQGKIPQFFIYNFAFRKLFWNKNASFGFTTTNPFNKYIKQISTITTENSTSRSVRQRPFRSFGVSFTLKFGKLESKRGGREENGNNEVMDMN